MVSLVRYTVNLRRVRVVGWCWFVGQFQSLANTGMSQRLSAKTEPLKGNLQKVLAKVLLPACRDASRGDLGRCSLGKPLPLPERDCMFLVT